MELKNTAYPEGTISAGFACICLHYYCRLLLYAYKGGLCSVSITLGLVTAWSCMSDDAAVSDEKFL